MIKKSHQNNNSAAFLCKTVENKSCAPCLRYCSLFQHFNNLEQNSSSLCDSAWRIERACWLDSISTMQVSFRNLTPREWIFILPCYNWFSILGNSKVLHCGITVFNMPYSIYTAYYRTYMRLKIKICLNFLTIYIHWNCLKSLHIAQLFGGSLPHRSTVTLNGLHWKHDYFSLFNSGVGKNVLLSEL